MASQRTRSPKRGAKQTSASRSAFRATKSTPAPKAERAPAKPAAKKASPKAARPVRVARPPVEATSPPAPAAVARAGQVLGEITVPSGTLAIFDIGLVGYLPREALAPAIVTCPVPRDRVLSVRGTRVGKGRFAACWDHVAVELGDGVVVMSKKLGEAGVDFARLVCMDLAALDAWQHEDSLDGKADVVFWGRDARLLGHVLNAPRLAEGYGWIDLPVAEAEAKADLVARKKAENRWLLASDLRPHSHHYDALAAARQSPDGAGMLDLAGTRMLLLFTSWGDGVFPIYLDVDHDDRPVQVRIQLATTASNSALASVNP